MDTTLIRLFDGDMDHYSDAINRSSILDVIHGWKKY